MVYAIIEDEHRIQEFLKRSVEGLGFHPESFRTISDFKTWMMISEHEADVVILDRMLPDGDGIEMIPSIKKRFPKATVIVLSSIDLSSEKAKCLDLGADDYLGKPFDTEELFARIRKVQSLKNHHSPSTFEKRGNILFDKVARRLLVGDRKIELTNKEFALFAYLFENPGRIFNKVQLLERIWNIEADIESNVVETTVKNLRKKLEESGADAKILSRRNLGYWFED